jgi:hypothetical protein
MQLYLAFLIVCSLAYFASAQSCTSSTSCTQCLNANNRWCSNSAIGYSGSGCCVSGISSQCPSLYSYSYYYNCNSWDKYYVYYSPYNRCDAGCIIGYVVWSVLWIVNMGCVVKYCRDRNIAPVGYVVIAFFFGLFVWCCLVPRGRQQLVIVQAGNVTYQAQPGAYAAQPYDQPSYGQPYAAGQPGSAYGQPQPAYNPPAPYGGAPPNPYSQPANPYSQPANPYSQPANPYSQPANPYSQPANPYGEISKPQ